MSDETKLSTDYVSLKIDVPHSDKTDWHQWYFPGAWPNHTPPTVMRDRRGRRVREGAYRQHWLVLHCSNTDCPAEALVPVRFVLDHANAHDRYAWDGAT